MSYVPGSFFSLLNTIRLVDFSADPAKIPCKIDLSYGGSHNLISNHTDPCNNHLIILYKCSTQNLEMEAQANATEFDPIYLG